MKSDTLRELLVSCFFASFLFALLSQFVLLRGGLIALENGGAANANEHRVATQRYYENGTGKLS
jgi:hypothetical protein